MRWCVFVALLAGCGRLGFEPIDDGGGAGGGEAGAPVCPQVPSCPDYSAPVGGSTNVSMPVERDHGLSTKKCGSGNGNPELAVQMRPILDGTYTVTVTPALTAVYIQDSCCGGTELACGMNPVTLTRAAGQNFVVVVEAARSTAVSIQVDTN